MDERPHGKCVRIDLQQKISSAKLVVLRYLASITMVLLPVLLLSLESLVPLISFGAKKGISVDYFAYIKYILWWLLPEVMAVSAIGIFFTLLTDSPIAIAIQFLWWMVDKGSNWTVRGHRGSNFHDKAQYIAWL